MGITININDGKKEFVKDVHRLARLGVQLMDCTSGVVSVHSTSESSLEVEVKKVQHLDPMLTKLKDSELITMNWSFSLGGHDILR